MPEPVSAQPSPWVRRFATLARPGATVLDLACGGGRHARFMTALGHRVTALDRDAVALAGVDVAETICADLEGAAWPLAGRSFDVIIVTNYLHRPLFPALLAALADDGVLIYETFAAGNESVGRPANPHFLLQPGELLQCCSGLRVIAFEDGYVTSPKAAFVQRICAVRAAPSGTPRRYAL